MTKSNFDKDAKRYTDGHMKVRRHAFRAQAAEELAEQFKQIAIDYFLSGDDSNIRDAKNFRAAMCAAAAFAKFERQLQSGLEKENGRFDA